MTSEPSTSSTRSQLRAYVEDVRAYRERIRAYPARMRNHLDANSKWLGNAAQLASGAAPLVALVAVILAWVAQDRVRDIAAASLQETSFNRAVDNVRHAANKVTEDKIVRGPRCLVFLASLPDDFVQQYFPGQARLFDEPVLRFTAADIKDDAQFRSLQQSLKECLGVKPEQDLAGAIDYSSFITASTGYLNALTLGLSTWRDTETQRRLVREHKRDPQEFCYLEKQFARICNKRGSVARFLDKYLKVKAGRDAIVEGVPDLVAFHERYCENPASAQKRKDCEKL